MGELGCRVSVSANTPSAVAHTQSTPQINSAQITQPRKVICRVAICKFSTHKVTYKINQRAFKMWQIEDPGEEHEEWAALGMTGLQAEVLEALGIIGLQAQVLEGSVVTLDSKLEKDMEAQPSDCRAADKKLSRILTIMDKIQAWTAAARS